MVADPACVSAVPPEFTNNNVVAVECATVKVPLFPELANPETTTLWPYKGSVIAKAFAVAVVEPEFPMSKEPESDW